MKFDMCINKYSMYENAFLPSEYYYYIKLISKRYASSYTTNGFISSYINITENEYKSKMINRFNAFKYQDIMLFKNKEDAQNAYDWVESMFLIQELIN
jgi:hypothetical protein